MARTTICVRGCGSLQGLLVCAHWSYGARERAQVGVRFVPNRRAITLISVGVFVQVCPVGLTKLAVVNIGVTGIFNM